MANNKQGGTRGPRPRDENGVLLPPKNPTKPREVYIVYDTTAAVDANGAFDKSAIKVATRNAKEALQTIDKAVDGSKLSYFSIMLK